MLSICRVERQNQSSPSSHSVSISSLSASCTPCTAHRNRATRTVVCTIYSQNAHFFSIDIQVFPYLFAFSHSFGSFMLQCNWTYEQSMSSVYADFSMSNAIWKTLFRMHRKYSCMHFSFVTPLLLVLLLLLSCFYMFTEFFCKRWVHSFLNVCSEYGEENIKCFYFFFYINWRSFDAFHCLIIGQSIASVLPAVGMYVENSTGENHKQSK